MKKTWTIITVIAVIAILVIYSISSYNSLVSQDESVSTAWSNVENQYQRRADLIPNLVNTVRICSTRERDSGCCSIGKIESYAGNNKYRRPYS